MAEPDRPAAGGSAKRPPPSATEARGPLTLVTGFPRLLARRLIQAELQRTPEHEPPSRVALLCHEAASAQAKEFAAALPEEQRARLQLLYGEVSHLHLGLSSAEYRALSGEVTDVLHAAESSQLSVDRAELQRINVEGTRTALDLAADAGRLRRFTHLSTVAVSGQRTGVVTEDELAMGQRFHDAWEETRYQAELLVRGAMAEVGCVVVRLGLLVGDSRTGEIDRFEGPHALAMLLAQTPASMPLPLPGDGGAPFNVVPIDFAASAAHALHHHPNATGKTFHLVDPNPTSVRRVWEQIAQRSGRKLPRVRLGLRLADTLLRLPGLERLTREQRSALAALGQLTFYSSRNTVEALGQLRCPPIEGYLDVLIDSLRAELRRRREA